MAGKLKTMSQILKIGPQKGPQEAFLSTPVDFGIYGGSAGGGKSFGLFLDSIRHYKTPIPVMFFRRTMPQITTPGSLWDKSWEIYPHLGATARDFRNEWIFPSGCKIKFTHLQLESTVYDHQGAEYPVMLYDELTHFTKGQFTYMMSRNRSTSGVKPYIRGTCNPDPDSWVAEFVEWYLDAEGFPVRERSGKIRWFGMRDNSFIFACTKKEIEKELGPNSAKSYTFIPSSLDDNPILLAKDPGYIVNLSSQSYVERMRLKEGNWRIKPRAGLYFKREWFEFVDAAPPLSKIVRFWDRAGTEKKAGNDPDWTAGVKLGRLKDGRYIILDSRRFRGSPMTVKASIKNTATQDGTATFIGLEQEPGSSGKADVQSHIANLSGFSARAYRPSVDKIQRASPFSAQCEAGNVLIFKGPWNNDFLDELESFPEGKKDDQVDACSGAFEMISQAAPGIKIF